MSNTRTKRKSSGSVAFSDINANDLQNDLRKSLNVENRKNDLDNQIDSENQTAYISKVYQDLVTTIMYSMFNPYVSFPEKRIDSNNDFDLEDDPNIPITEDYESPVTTLKLKVASKEDDKIRSQLLQYTDKANEENSENLNNNEEYKNSNISFISVDLSLPQASISRNIQRRERRSQEETDKRIKDKKEQRNQQVKTNREMIHNQKEFELQEERNKRREKYNEREANMSSKEKRRLEVVRKELQDGKSRASTSVASRSTRPDDNQTSKTHEYLEVQKSQKNEYLKTRGKAKKQDNIASILMGNY